MNRNQVTMQLYTTRKFQPYEPIFKFLSESGIKNIELFDLDKIDLDNFKSMMEENSISIKSSHISFQAITNTEETISRMKYLNIKHAIVPSVPEKFSKDFASNFDLDEDTWNNFGKDLSSYVQTYEDNGLTLGYHNHSFEFRPLPSGKLPIECMMDHNENLKMELDLGWAVAGKADPLNWIEKYKNKIEKAGMSKEALKKAKSEFSKFKMMSPTSAEASVVRSYLECLIDVPWKKRGKVKSDIKAALETLNDDHYGLEEVKDRILEYLAVQKRVKNLKAPVFLSKEFSKQVPDHFKDENNEIIAQGNVKIYSDKKILNAKKIIYNKKLIFLYIMLFLSYSVPLIYGYFLKPIIYPRYIMFVLIPIILIISILIFYLENKKVSNKLASLAIVASAIMNLDEFLTHG